MNNQPKEPRLPATDSTPRPGDFPIGSPESRAAVRAMLKRTPSTTIRATIVHIGQDGSKLPAPERIKWPGGVTEIRHALEGAS